MRAAGVVAVLAAQSCAGLLGGPPREHVGLLRRSTLHSRQHLSGAIDPEEPDDAGTGASPPPRKDPVFEDAAKRFERSVMEADRAQQEFEVPAKKSHRITGAEDRFSELVGRLQRQLKSFQSEPQEVQDGDQTTPDVQTAAEPETSIKSGSWRASASGVLAPQNAARKFARLVRETEMQTPVPTVVPQLPDAVKKPLMSSINVIRTEMCWKRPNLMEHEKCMRFLGLHCLKGSTGKGICKAFRKQMADACKNKAAKSPELQKLQCDLDHDLNKKEDDRDPEGDDDKDGSVNAEDLFPDDPNESDDTDMDGVGDNADDDKDGDGIKNDEDLFPMDAKEWLDTDGDGIGDNADEDRDGDDVPDHEDAFPHDKNEWKDLDGDGIGDNSDNDRDGDGHANNQDPFPDDPTRYPGSENEGLGLPGMPKNLDQPVPGADEEVVEDDVTEGQVVEGGSIDSDGDGVVDEEDAFPQDPSESADTDGDGVGDNADNFPEDASEQMDSDGDGVGDNGDHFPDDPNENIDSDGDGFGDMSDAFPGDANEWLDSDGDGVGDNADVYPNNPDCHADPCGSPDVVVAASPAGAPAGAPAAPGVAPPMILPWELNKVGRELPPQGYNEHSRGHDDLVEHADMETWTHDWGKEWPHKKESEKASIGRICDKYPDSHWCKKYEQHGHFAR